MAERETVYISQLPEITTLTDDVVFVTDDGADNNKVTADNLATYLNKKINIDDKLSVAKTEMKTYTDEKVDEACISAVTQSKQYTNSTVSNPNLLINGDFQVWQRGTEITQSANTNKYTADGWILGFVNDGKTHTVKKDTDGSMYIDPNGGYTKLRQVIEIPDSLRGETVFLQVCAKSGKSDSSDAVLQIGNGTYTDGTWGSPTISAVTATSEYAVFTASFTIPTTGLPYVEIYVYSTNILNIKWVKLEAGSVGTAFSPKNYGEELALCQRYYQIYKSVSSATAYLGSAYVNNAGGTAYVHMAISEMRKLPTLQISSPEHFECWNGTAGHKTLSALTLYAADSQNKNITLSGTLSETVTERSLAFSFVSGQIGNAYIAFDAAFY